MSFNSIVEATKMVMTSSDPKRHGKLATFMGVDTRGEEEEEEDSVGEIRTFDIARDVTEYFIASPMRLVFTLLTDEEGRDRVMSIGDMALLAIWIKVCTLKLD